MANLIQNGDFSAGLTGWTAANIALNNGIFNNAPPSAQMVGFTASLTQSITIPQAGIYNLNFFVLAQQPVFPNTLTVDINGVLSPFIIPNINIWNQFGINFNALAGSTTISFFNTSGFPNTPGISIFLDDVSVTAIPIICYSGESIVNCRNKITREIADVKVKDITSTTHEVYSTKNKKFVPVKYNILPGITNRFMLIKKDSLGENQPSEDFYVTSGHILLINGKEIKARRVPGAKRIKVNSEKVYSICVENRQPIMVNGLEVMAWGKSKWLDYADKKGLVWTDNKLE